MPKWTSLPIEQALELLGSQYSVPAIRQLAVRSLSDTKDAILECLLMPLVVALRYEPASEPSPLSLFLIERAVACPYLAMPLFWCLTVERSCGGPHVGVYRSALALLCRQLEERKLHFSPHAPAFLPSFAQEDGSAAFVRDSSNPVDEVAGLKEGSENGWLMIDVLRRQEHFVACLAGMISKLPLQRRVSCVSACLWV